MNNNRLKQVVLTFALAVITNTVIVMISGCTRLTEIGLTNQDRNNQNLRSNYSIVNDKSSKQLVDINGIPTVTYCDLIAEGSPYDKKIVRVKAVFYNSFEKSYLYDRSCQKDTSESSIRMISLQSWVDFAADFVKKGKSEQARKNRLISGFGEWEVTSIGRFSRASGSQPYFGHLNCCQFRFEIIKIENSVLLSRFDH